MTRRDLPAILLLLLALAIFAGVGIELAMLPLPLTAAPLHCPPPGSMWACSP